MKQEFLEKLHSILPKKRIITEDKEKFDTDWRQKFYTKSIAIIFPISVDEIKKIIHFCRLYQIGITEQGGNTSKCAAAIVSNNESIIINFSHMNKIIKFNNNNSSIIVEAGCTISQINDYLQQFNLTFPIKLASDKQAQIGATIAINAGGINTIKYGTTRDNVLGLEVVLANGTVVNQLHELHKRNINFDIKQLFIGSEGTLGIITKATLKLVPKAHNNILLIFHLENFDDSIIILTFLRNYGITPNMFEIINQYTIDIYNNVFVNNRIDCRNNWVLLCNIEIFINTDSVMEIVKKIQYEVDIITDISQQEKILESRYNIPLAEKKYCPTAVKFDLGFPINKISKFLELNKKSLKSFNLHDSIIVFGHVGDGSIHYNIFLNSLLEDLVSKVQLITYSNVYLCDGTFSAEHGIGQIKKELLLQYEDTISVIIGKVIKQNLDSTYLLNIGKIF